MSDAIEYNADAEVGAAEAAAQAALVEAQLAAELLQDQVNIVAADALAETSLDDGPSQLGSEVSGGRMDGENKNSSSNPFHSEASKSEGYTISSYGRKKLEGKDLETFFMSLNTLDAGGLVKKGHHVVNVSIGDPQTQKSLTSSFTTYAVTIEPRIEEIKFVRRRYSDFVWLRKWLVEAFPGIFIPPLPPKNFFGKMKEDFIEARRLGLEEFMGRLISRHHFVIHSVPFQLFVSKHSNTFEKQKRDIEKQINAQTDASITKMYASFFPEMATISLPKETEERVLRLKDYLTNAGKQVNMLLESSNQISDKWNDILEHSGKVTGALKSLSKVENGYAQRPEPARLDVVGKFEAWSDTISEKPKQWSSTVSEIFKHEKLDIDAMLQVVAKWEAIYKRLSKQQIRVGKYEKGDGELNDKQKAAKERDEEILRNLNAMFEIISKILFESEVLHYWDNKTKNFNGQVHSFFQTQLKVSSRLAQVWAEEKKSGEE